MKFDRNKKIDIGRLVEAQNTYGEQTEDYEVVKGSIWASIVPSSGKEFFIAEQMQSEVTSKIGIEYMEGIAKDMFVTYGSRKFQIMYVINPKEQNRELILMCKELI